jgi:hypothetical protein
MSWELLRYYQIANVMDAQVVVTEMWRLLLNWAIIAMIIIIGVVMWDMWRR